MTADPLVLSAELDRATARLLDTVRTLDGNGLTAPSRCAGWTRGHVVTHLARNADAYRNLLSWARTGVKTPAYTSREAREEGIAAGAARPHDEQLADLTTACDLLRESIDTMPAQGWSAQVEWGTTGPAPAARVVWSRICEVELHHVDLDAGYGPANWPESFTLRVLHDPATPHAATLVSDDGTTLLSASDDAPVVTGPVHLLAAWLTGRGDGTGLTGDLPSLEAWK
ncbi:maleylpyruvate isomerase family mycothiol-dependent enzyme [Dactylosporangium sp. NPDC005555]|uniref:maleylpyruvate isomerase family mycothiol-dependent enzyme n=1 Tax=Dactylosporangium sp. NPDC005555 TaxID=3154889 RepID=UPI0033A5A69C